MLFVCHFLLELYDRTVRTVWPLYMLQQWLRHSTVVQQCEKRHVFWHLLYVGLMFLCWVALLLNLSIMQILEFLTAANECNQECSCSTLCYRCLCQKKELVVEYGGNMVVEYGSNMVGVWW